MGGGGPERGRGVFRQINIQSLKLSIYIVTIGYKTGIH